MSNENNVLHQLPLRNDGATVTTDRAVSPDLGSTNLAEVAREVVRALTCEPAFSGVSVHLGALPCVAGRAEDLRQVLRELVAGAAKRRCDGPARIRVTATPVNGWWLVSVAADGPLSADEFQLLADESAGTARAIVKRLGGRVWGESNAGRGGVVHFTVPPTSVPGTP